MQKISCKDWLIPLICVQISSCWETGWPNSPYSPGEDSHPFRALDSSVVERITFRQSCDSKVENRANRPLGLLYLMVFYSWGWIKWHEYETYNLKKDQVNFNCVTVEPPGKQKVILACVVLNEARVIVGGRLSCGFPFQQAPPISSKLMSPLRLHCSLLSVPTTLWPLLGL